MLSNEDKQLPVYTCPESGRSFVCATPGDRVEASLHRALHIPDRSKRLGYLRLLKDYDHRPYSFR
jgi:hypothetical protein